MKFLFVLFGICGLAFEALADCIEHSVQVQGRDLYSCQNTTGDGLVLSKGLNTANFRSFLKLNESDKKLVTAIEKVSGASYAVVVDTVEKAYKDDNPFMVLYADTKNQIKDLQEIANLYNEQRALTVVISQMNGELNSSDNQIKLIMDMNTLDSIAQSNNSALASLKGSCESNSKTADKVKALTINFSDGQKKVVVPAGMVRISKGKYRLDFIGKKAIESRYLIEEGGKIRYEDQEGNQWVVRVNSNSYSHAFEKGAAPSKMSNACYLAQAYTQATDQAVIPQVTQGSAR